jgi:hypothetical protein
MVGNERKASLRGGDFVDALPIPIDGNFEWAECRFALFDYTKKDGTVVATTCAGRVTFKDEAGQEFVQHYSVGDPARVLPSTDGKSIVMQGDNRNLNKSSNFFILINALESAGLDPDFLGEDFSVLEGMVTHNIGVPEPDRVGLREAPAAGETRRVRVLAVPDDVITQPGGKKGKAAVGKAKAATADLLPEALGMIAELLAGGEEVTRKSLASHAIKARRAPIATLAFQLTNEQLAEGEFMVDDKDVITAA